jgi:hypothetical protein
MCFRELPKGLDFTWAITQVKSSPLEKIPGVFIGTPLKFSELCLSVWVNLANTWQNNGIILKICP